MILGDGWISRLGGGGETCMPSPFPPQHSFTVDLLCSRPVFYKRQYDYETQERPLCVHCDHHKKKTETSKGYRENVFGLHPSPDTKCKKKSIQTV